MNLIEKGKASSKLIFNDPSPDINEYDIIPNVDCDLEDKTNNSDNFGKSKNNKKSKKKEKIDQSLILNPFFVKSTGGDAMLTKLGELYKNYTRLFFLCIKDDVDIENASEHISKLYKKELTQDEMTNALNYVILVEGSVKMLRYIYLRKRTNRVKKECLIQICDYEKYDLDELVVLVLNVKESKIKIFLESTQDGDGINTSNKLRDVLALTKMYDRKSNILMDDRIVSMINSLDTMGHWRDPKNCQFNMDDIFCGRSLSYNGHRLDLIRFATLSGAKTLNNMLTQLNKTKTKTYKISKNDYYLDEMNSKSNKMKSEHMNIYQVLRDSNNRTFFATIDVGQFGLTKESVADLFDSIKDEKYRFQLLNVLLTSKDLCHFAINNKRVLVRNSDIIQRYKPLYAYLLQYAWTTMYLEEAIFTTRSTKKNRFVFDIDTAYELPLFPFSFENIHSNPYVSLLLNRTLINPESNCMSIPPMEDYKKYYGVCSRTEALARFNTFVSGDCNKNIFEGLDPNLFSFSGSIITACIQKRSPLMDLCSDSTLSFEDSFGGYFKHYYEESDVDVMCAVATMAEFFHHGSIFLQTLTKNLGCSREDLHIVPNKKMAVVLSKHFFKECVWDLNNEIGTNYTVNDLIELFEKSTDDNNGDINTLPPNVLNYFYVDYVEQKNLMTKRWNKLQKQMGINFDNDLLSTFNFVTAMQDMVIKMVSYDLTEDMIRKKDSEIYYFVNDFRSEEDKVPAEKNFMVMKFSESIKYKIESTALNRIVEIFKIDAMDPFNTVGRFHMPCVRAYLQGETFYMLPSFITSMMSCINIDYKYFAGSRDPIEIINKYRMRGYSVILNTNEKKSMMKYNRFIDTSNGQFTTQNDSEEFGMKELSHKIFRPAMFKSETKHDMYKPSEHKYIKTMEDLEQTYNKESPKDISHGYINILDFNAISPNGNIDPYKPWVAMAYYDYINS